MTDQTTGGKSFGQLVVAAFTAHPRQAGETYWQHLVFTFGMAGQLIAVFFMLVVHGLLPFLFTHAASRHMHKCQRILNDRAARTGFNEMSDGIGI